MSFKIGDNVILISVGKQINFTFLIGRAFQVESNLVPDEETGELMHIIGPKPQELPTKGLMAVPQFLMKIDPPDDMRWEHEQRDLHDKVTQ